MRDRMILAAGLAAVALAPMPALADARDDVLSGITRCAGLSDDRQWLDCYYGAAQPMRAALGLAPAPQAQIKLLQVQPQARVSGLPTTVARAAVRTGPPPMPRHSGFFDFTGGDDIVVNTPLQSYQLTPNGFVVTLPDGQVWEQTGVDHLAHAARWRQPASAMRVTISQGAAHTFNLRVGDENTHYKVTRAR